MISGRECAGDRRVFGGFAAGDTCPGYTGTKHPGQSCREILGNGFAGVLQMRHNGSTGKLANANDLGFK